MPAMDSNFGRRDQLERNRHQYSASQHHHNGDRQQVPREDGYRAQQDFVDDVEDECLDDFDHGLLQHEYDNLRSQAARGQARLSLPPRRDQRQEFAPQVQRGPSRQVQSHRPTRVTNQSGPDIYHDAGHEYGFSKPMRNLSQYTCTASQAQEPSSEVPWGISSSPTLKASQRRGEVNTTKSHPERTASTESETTETRQAHVARTAQQVPPQNSLNLRNVQSGSMPVVQGIHLVPVSRLPDRLRAVFPFPNFNAVQSKCFESVYGTDDNFVLASPTGSGKTAILELAICRAVANNAVGHHKIVYQAPLKALCSERQRDWQAKFHSLGLKCIELTGDSDHSNTNYVQGADIIVTTPEKWDSITRKWKDHEKLMRLIKLFLIDEVHILGEQRGAILEAVVSRMKTTGTNVRFVALSATVPNLEDVATWLGRNPATPQEPASCERFGEKFRPVQLERHVHGYPCSGNDWAFDKTLDKKIIEVISRYSRNKPIMVFCVTRKYAESTAHLLASWWSSSKPQNRAWKQPSRSVAVNDDGLRKLAPCGVAFHHGGVDGADRKSIEEGFLQGNINVICCTSTLAVGVNLPCHLVVIKNTVKWENERLQEYSDLEIMQMVGRAGRPQFDKSAVAVIMTRSAKVRRYENMVTGQEALESKLHRGLIEHLNAEISLGTIQDIGSARDWLSKTFLYVRIRQRPEFYKLEGSRSGQDIVEQLDDICLRGLSLLQQHSLVTGEDRYKCTAFGNAMANYYVDFDTMKVIVGLPEKAQISEILSALSQASAFKELRFRTDEKLYYRILNSSPMIRFSIPVTLNLSAHKVSLIIQAVLGGANYGGVQPHWFVDVNIVFKHVHRIIRCIVDCQVALEDAVAVNNALLVQRSLRAQAWDDSPYPMRQLHNIGIVSVRCLVQGGIKSMEELEHAEPHRIETCLKKNPPYGLKLLEQVHNFPRLYVTANELPNTRRRTEDGVLIQLKVQVGVLNDKPVDYWHKKHVYMCFVADTSDGKLARFARISGKHLGKEQTLSIPVLLRSPDLSINCYFMCEDIAGTMRQTSTKPKIPASMFPNPQPPVPILAPLRGPRPTSNTSKRRVENNDVTRKSSDDFDDGGLGDDELVQASFNEPLGDQEFEDIDNYANPNDNLTKKNTSKDSGKQKTGTAPARTKLADEPDEITQLPNGKWPCNHKCKDKTACKHLCCRDGLEKLPKRPLKKNTLTEPSTLAEDSGKVGVNKTQSKLHVTPLKRKPSGNVEVLDMTQEERKKKKDLVKKGPWDCRNLHQLHKNIQKHDPPASISSITHKKPAYNYSKGGEHNLAFMDPGDERGGTAMSTDYSDLGLDDLMDIDGFIPSKAKARGLHHENDHVPERVSGFEEGIVTHESDNFGDDDSQLEEVLVGLADSQNMQEGVQQEIENHIEDFGIYDDDMFDLTFDDHSTDKHQTEDVNMSTPVPSVGPSEALATTYGSTTSLLFEPSVQDKRSSRKPEYGQPNDTTLGEEQTSSPFFAKTARNIQRDTRDGFRPAKSMLMGREIRELAKAKAPEKKARVDRTHITPAFEKPDQNLAAKISEPNYAMAFEEEEKKEEKNVDERYKDIEPWFLEEFGDVVELVDE